MKLKQQFNFFKLFQITKIVIKRKGTKFKGKTNQKVTLKIWRAKHENREGKIKKKKKKVVDAKIEVRWPYTLPRYGGTIKMIWMSPE